MSDSLNLRWWRDAFFSLLEAEQPTELTRRTYETQCEGPHISVNELTPLEQTHERVKV